MITKNVDIAIIGVGTAGMVAYHEARKQTNSIALIEGGEYGTTCARVGCMPSKLLIAAADAANHSRHASLFGVNISNVEIDGKAVLERVRRERDRFVNFSVADVDSYDPDHKLRGYARFIDDNTLLVDSHTKVRAKRIVIATGSLPFISNDLKKAGKRLLVNDSLFELEDLPSSILVVGTGVIGLELGQALSRLGVNVTLVGRGHSLGGIVDDEIRSYAAKVFTNDVELLLNTSISDILEHDDGVDVTTIDANGTKKKHSVDYVLAAIGRKPNLDKLGLSNTSLILNAKGVPEFNNQSMQTSVPHIFIAGDANNELPLLHESSDEGYIAGRNAGHYPDVELVNRRTSLGIVFSDPQIASVGVRPHNLQADEYIEGSVNFEKQGRSRVMGVNKGILKVYIQKKTGVFLGAEMFGPAAEHIGHLLAWVAQQELTVKDILDLPFYHPVIEEGVRSAFRSAYSQLKLSQA